MFLYALKFDMDRLFACLDDMEGFLDSNITHTPTLYIDPSRPHFILIFSLSLFFVEKYIVKISYLNAISAAIRSKYA
jgi:hypothetical protein